MSSPTISDSTLGEALVNPDSDRTFTSTQRTVRSSAGTAHPESGRSIYDGLPDILKPHDRRSTKPSYEELATVPPLSLRLHPALLRVRSFPRPPELEFGYPITAQQIKELCVQAEHWPNQPIEGDEGPGSVSMIALVYAGNKLTDNCQIRVQVHPVANHPEKYVASFGNNYQHYTDIQEDVKERHIRILSKTLGLSNQQPMWYLATGAAHWTYSHCVPDTVGL